MDLAQAAAAAAAAGSGEVRRVHIIYFLSRRGQIEQPHLIRVHHLSKNGVRLRDVKRWLSELRGKDMPESFAWSYKRRYKTGYLWQDLLDDDLITPIADNEYVLKGCEISTANFGKKLATKEESSPSRENQETSRDESAKTSSELDEDSAPFSSESSTLTDDSPKPEEGKDSEETKQELETRSEKFDNLPSLYPHKNDEKNKSKTSNGENNSAPASFKKSKSYSVGASGMFRNLITCGAADTKESAVVVIKRKGKKSSSSSCCSSSSTSICSASSLKSTKKQEENRIEISTTAEICRGERLGGSQRIFATCWNQEQPHHPDPRKSYDGGKSTGYQKPISPAYRPVNGPICSQCGKQFKPEKMHKHMMSCKGMKDLTPKPTSHPEAASAETASEPRESMHSSSYQQSVSTYFLTR